MFMPITIPYGAVMLYNVLKLKPGVTLEDVELAIGEMCNVVKNTYGDEKGGFIGGQVFEYTELVKHEGLSLSSDPYGSAFYLTTGFHGLHVTGGLIAFLLVLGRTYAARRFTHEQATAAIVVSYYWHFVDVVWIGLFATIYMIK